MGLDMYLNKYPRVGIKPDVIDAIEDYKNWIEDGKPCSLEKYCGIKREDLPDEKTIEELEKFRHPAYAAWDVFKKWPENRIHENVGYWRKANAIHKWFVDNVQDGRDDCEYHLVTFGDLLLLKDACVCVLENHNMSKILLPTCEGFFFGPQDYNDDYFNDLKYTFNLCEKLLKETDFENYSLYYQSSW